MKPRNALGCLTLVVGLAVVVLPLLLWTQTILNLHVIGVLLHQDGYSRARFEITEYGHWTEGAGEFMHTQHYFHGSVDGRPESMSVTFARSSPMLAAIMDTAPRGRTPLALSIDVWYNPNVRGSWLAREHAILPYEPDFFASLYPGLARYAMLWLAFVGIWMIIVLVPRFRRGPPFNRGEPQTPGRAAAAAPADDRLTTPPVSAGRPPLDCLQALAREPGVQPPILAERGPWRSGSTASGRASLRQPTSIRRARRTRAVPSRQHQASSSTQGMRTPERRCSGAENRKLADSRNARPASGTRRGGCPARRERQQPGEGDD